MTMTDNMTTQQVLDAVGRLAPVIAERSAEIERGRRVPGDLRDDLISAGCFALFRPASHGGVGADLPAGLRVLESLARADASVAWIVMIGSTAWCDLTGLPRLAFDDLFASGSGIVAGAFNPTGTIEAHDNTYRVTGRWSFASGCEDADWIYGNCIEGIVDGAPVLRIAVFSPDQIVIEDTWSVVGLAGTGSHHFHVDGVEIPAERTCVPMSEETCVDDPIVRVPIPALISLCVASVAVGIAQGAIDDIVAIATEKVPLLDHEPLAANRLFQFELGRAETALRACRALLNETAETTWSLATSGSAFTLDDRARARAAAVWATEQAATVVDTAYRLGGGTSLYRDCALQRRLRDVHALTQHFIVKRETLATCGAVFAGQDVDVFVF